MLTDVQYALLQLAQNDLGSSPKILNLLFKRIIQYITCKMGNTTGVGGGG